MIITRIKAKNFKTYLDLDLDLSVQADKPIILIGGKNGGGKTTLFEAIYGALYGLKLSKAKQFKELLNAGSLGKEEERIFLELHFVGRVLNQEQKYILTRTYILNTSELPVESVRLNMNGTIFAYGTATPPNQRVESETQVNKIIKANLPEELSRYFLFDAMVAGDLLKDDQLNRVIKENIENVMGFNKYMHFAKASESLFQRLTAEKLKEKTQREEYLALVEKKKKLEQQIEDFGKEYEIALQYSLNHREMYENYKKGIDQEKECKNKIDQLNKQISLFLQKENDYVKSIDTFIKEIDQNIALPKLADSLKSQIMLILKSKEENKNDKNSLNNAQIGHISKLVCQFLAQQSLDISSQELSNYLQKKIHENSLQDDYAFLDTEEMKALESLLSRKGNNNFLFLYNQKNELEVQLHQIPNLKSQIEIFKQQITGEGYDFLKTYEQNEEKIHKTQSKIQEIKNEYDKISKDVHNFDISGSQEADIKYNTLQKLKDFFETLANQLLKNKKQQIEIKMKEDLNRNLIAYKDVIDRVELSENLSKFTFKVYHKVGNEIYLSQLNTASKQVLVQVLLKALHEFGDYEPPVMIDTVMGVLDETSRMTLLENYFPLLSHQTILLSSDSEIRVEKDLDKIKSKISKLYTLERDREQQLTEVKEGYFDIFLN